MGADDSEGRALRLGLGLSPRAGLSSYAADSGGSPPSEDVHTGFPPNFDTLFPPIFALFSFRENQGIFRFPLNFREKRDIPLIFLSLKGERGKRPFFT